MPTGLPTITEPMIERVFFHFMHPRMEALTWPQLRNICRLACPELYGEAAPDAAGPAPRSPALPPPRVIGPLHELPPAPLMYEAPVDMDALRKAMQGSDGAMGSRVAPEPRHAPPPQPTPVHVDLLARPEFKVLASLSLGRPTTAGGALPPPPPRPK